MTSEFCQELLKILKESSERTVRTSLSLLVLHSTHGTSVYAKPCASRTKPFLKHSSSTIRQSNRGKEIVESLSECALCKWARLSSESRIRVFGFLARESNPGNLKGK